MGVVEAAKVYEDTTREISRLESQRKAAKQLLVEWFEKHPDKRDYRGRIGYSQTVRRIWDQDKLVTELGDRVPDFKRPIDVVSLSLLK